jgi:histone H3/H4
MPKFAGKRNPVDEIRNPDIMRIARDVMMHGKVGHGQFRVSAGVYPTVRNHAAAFLQKMAKDAVVSMRHQRRKTIMIRDVTAALEQML